MYYPPPPYGGAVDTPYDRDSEEGTTEDLETLTSTGTEVNL